MLHEQHDSFISVFVILLMEIGMRYDRKQHGKESELASLACAPPRMSVHAHTMTTTIYKNILKKVVHHNMQIQTLFTHSLVVLIQMYALFASWNKKRSPNSSDHASSLANTVTKDLFILSVQIRLFVI